MTDGIVLGFGAAGLAAGVAFLLCMIAIKARFGLDPVSERSSHTAPTPRTGGLMVLASVVVVALVLSAFGAMPPRVTTLLALVVGAGAIGLIDDFLKLAAPVKLVGQTGLATFAVLVLGPVQSIPLPLLGWTDAPTAFAMALSAFWLVAIMNVVNFMDGLNGLVASYAIVALAAAPMMLGEPVFLLFAVQGALFGFLLVNGFSGRIFLGDAGSLSLGFLLGAVPLVGGQGSHAFWLMPLVVLPLIADVAVTLVRRALRGADLSEAHREHAYQLLKADGWSHQAVATAVLVMGVAAVAISAVLGDPDKASPTAYWLAALAIGAIWLAGVAVMRFLKSGRVSLERSLR